MNITGNNFQSVSGHICKIVTGYTPDVAHPVTFYQKVTNLDRARLIDASPDAPEVSACSLIQTAYQY